jgi:DNA polymerase-3 subunit gamma/tau
MQMCSFTSHNNPFKEVAKVETIKPVVKSVTPEVKSVITEPVKKVDEVKKEETKVEEKKPDVVEEPQVKITSKKIVHDTKSILETLAEKDKKNVTPENGNVEEATGEYLKPEKEFTKEEFEKAWLTYAEQFKQDSPDLYVTLTSKMPELKDDFTIELTIENVVQEKEIADRKLDMLTFFRNELSNYKLQLQTVVNKNHENIKPFTPQEKFKKMAEKNPAIKKLKDKFDLEIDF